jgi:hypothetical protein
MADAKAQRDFLLDCAISNVPMIYCDGAATHAVYLARVRLSTPHKGPEGEVAELVFVEAQDEDWGAVTGWREQLKFLNDAQNDVLPVMYCDTSGTWRRMALAKVTAQVPYRGPRGLEPVVQLSLVELWRGESLEGVYGVSEYDRAIYGGGV